MSASAQAASEIGEPIVIYQSIDSEGSTFSLSHDARRALRDEFGDLHLSPRIFVAHERRDDFTRLHGALARKLLALLTGLDESVLAARVVEFRDPVTDRLR